MDDVAEVRAALKRFLDRKDSAGRVLGDVRCGIYAFFDYENQPLYVGQTSEKVRARIQRHLTNQRTDAIAMGLLDPGDVAFVEVWPFYQEVSAEILSAAEYTVYERVVSRSIAKATLNEKTIQPTPLISIPESVKGMVVPTHLFNERKHPDRCLARKVRTLAVLTEVVQGRVVSQGLRRALHTQARIVERLSRERLHSTPDQTTTFEQAPITDVLELLGGC